MRARLIAGLFLSILVPFTTGCAGMSKTAQGAGIGGGLGAATGALIGSTQGSKGAGTGALIGGAIGALGGGLVGNDMDQQDKAAKEVQLQQAEARVAAAQSQLGMSDIIQLTQSMTPDELIINQIRTTNSTYQLSTEDLRTLQANNVSQKVILEMQNRRPNAVTAPPPPTYIVRPSRPRVIYAPPPPVYVVEPPPPPGFGVGVIYRR